MKIEFDDATIEAARVAWMLDGAAGTSEFFSRYYAAAANKQLEAAEKPVFEVPPLQYVRPQGYDIDAMRAHFHTTELYQKGDARLVWVNEGELDRHASWPLFMRSGQPGLSPALKEGCKVEEFGDEFVDVADRFVPAAGESPAIDWKARAEKAEARLEEVRVHMEEDLQSSLTQDQDQWECGYNAALENVANRAGFRIIPAQALRVEVGDE